MRKKVLRQFCAGLVLLIICTLFTGFASAAKIVSAEKRAALSRLEVIASSVGYSIQEAASRSDDINISNDILIACQLDFFRKKYGLKSLSISATADPSVHGDKPGTEVSYSDGKLSYCRSISVELKNGRYEELYISAALTSQDIYRKAALTGALSALPILIITIVYIIWFLSRHMKKINEELKLSEYVTRCAEGNFESDPPKISSPELKSLSSAVVLIAQQLQNSSLKRNEFVSNVSHELKTPLTTINGFITGIIDGTIAKEKRKKYLMRTQSEVNRMNRLVTTMLNITRLQTGSLDLKCEKINLSKMIVEIFFLFEMQIEEKKLDISGLDGDPVFINGDENILFQIMYNLIENAVKFTEKGGEIEISVYSENNFVYINIKNSGKGINNQDIQKIFDRFYKTDASRSLDITGIGLGLSIVKKLLNFNNGNITVVSIPNEHTEFTVTLPSSQL